MADLPLGRWDVYVDAATGEPLAREQTLHFATGTVKLDIPNRWPQNGRVQVLARGLTVTVAGSSMTTDESGKLTFTGTMATLAIRASGPLVAVSNDAGSNLSVSAMLTDGGTATAARPDNEFDDAQLNCFAQGRVVKDRAKIISPSMSWLNQSLSCSVNLSGSCNAFSDGTNINFYRSGDGCGNIGRLADVVYHEFGHSYHNHGKLDGTGWDDGALGEGVGDYMSVTITEDPGMGRGFFNNHAPLRNADPPNGEMTWPQDAGEIHTTGEIYVGAMWDLRKNMVGGLGHDPGVAHSDFIFFEQIKRAVDIPSTYVEALAADDDDGNIDNGTPNRCLIDEAFARHGLAEPGADVGPGVRTPILDQLHVTVPVTGQNSTCPGKDIEKVELKWQVRGVACNYGNVPRAAGAVMYTGVIPPAADGSVINYQVVVSFGDMTTLTFPDNAADPMYELFIGETVPIYCTDFEGASEPAGWTHALDSGTAGEGADDWIWGTSAGTSGSGDPGDAYSGTKVYGNDLGGGNFNGQYQADKVNHLLSPEIDTTGHTHVRLQYRRWLNIEDGDFDKGTISVDGAQKWQNFATGGMGTTNHIDREWRFHDVELDAEAADGKLQVKFELASDGGQQMGGWTIDDFCVVAYLAATCGDGEVAGGEQCDDGAGNSDTAPDGCRTDCTGARCGDGVIDGGEACDDGGTVDGDGCSATCTAEAGAFCGNGTVDDGEACDDGNAIDDDACTNACLAGPGGGETGDMAGTCGCRTGHRRGSAAPLAALALLAGLALAVRRRRPS
jgi:cysteine-rich repeat protein